MIETLFALIENSRGWDAAALALILFILHALASNTAWRVAHAPTSTVARRLRDLSAHPASRIAFEILRLLFYVGVPFAALYLGWVDLRSMGLSPLDWAEGIRWAIVILLAAWLILTAIWLPYLRATGDVLAPPPLQQSFPRRIVELIYMQAHWAFYRAAAIVLFAGVIPGAFYWGAMCGLGLTALEALADPRVRERLTQIGAADGVVWNLGQAVINTLAFLVTRNLFLLVLIHFVLEVTVPHWRPIREPDRTRAAPGALRQSPGARE